MCMYRSTGIILEYALNAVLSLCIQMQNCANYAHNARYALHMSYNSVFADQ